MPCETGERDIKRKKVKKLPSACCISMLEGFFEVFFESFSLHLTYNMQIKFYTLLKTGGMDMKNLGGNKGKHRTSGFGAKRRLAGLLAGTFALLIILCGCGAKSGSDSVAVVEETAAAMDMGTAAPAYAERNVAAFPQLGSDALLEQSGSTGSPAETAETGAGASEGVERKLIRTIELNVQTREFDELLSAIADRAERLGGYVESSYQDGAAGHNSYRTAHFTVRIPAESTDEYLETALSGALVTYRSESTEDVTLRYTDMESRMKALRVEQERLTELLSKADSIESVIAIESRLSEVRYEVESIESQLRSYDDRISFDTINISISEVQVMDSGAEAGFSERIRTGFEKNLAGLRAGLEDLIIFLVINLPFIMVVAVFAFLIYIIVRKIRRLGHISKSMGSEKTDRDIKAAASDADDQGGKA